MTQELTPIQKVIWTVNAKPREQVFMLRLIDAYGLSTFTATIDEIAKLTGTPRGTTVRCLTGLRDLGWVNSERMYKKTGINLPSVMSCEYSIAIEKEPVTAPTE